MKKGLDKLVGLGSIKRLARIDIDACNIRREVFPHTILRGIGGTGKTAFAVAIAEELGYHCVTTMASSLKTRRLIIERIISAETEARAKGKILLLFVDELHRLSRERQEEFYYAMDEKDPCIFLPERQKLRRFTLVGATTRPDALEVSFMTRFVNQWVFERYPMRDIVRIVGMYFAKENIPYGVEHCQLIAERSLGIPRQALRLSKKIRNLTIGRGYNRVHEQTCENIFSLERIDSIGLTPLHVKYLELLAEGHAMGIDALAGKLGEQSDVISGTVEPVLLSLNMVDMTGRGRVITSIGSEHLKKGVAQSPIHLTGKVVPTFAGL